MPEVMRLEINPYTPNNAAPQPTRCLGSGALQQFRGLKSCLDVFRAHARHMLVARAECTVGNFLLDSSSWSPPFATALSLSLETKEPPCYLVHLCRGVSRCSYSWRAIGCMFSQIQFHACLHGTVPN